MEGANSLLHLKFLAFRISVRGGPNVELLVRIFTRFFSFKVLTDLVRQTSTTPFLGVHDSSSRLLHVPRKETGRPRNSLIAHIPNCPGLRTEYTDPRIHRDLRGSRQKLMASKSGTAGPEDGEDDQNAKEFFDWNW